MDFIGREEELQHYRDFLKGGSDAPWAMVITGMECIGKSYLLDRMRKEVPSDCSVLYLDFANESLHTSDFCFTLFYKLVAAIFDDCDHQKRSNFMSVWKDTLAPKVESGSTTQQTIVGFKADITDAHISSKSGTRDNQSSAQDVRREKLTTELREVLPSFRRDRRLLILLDNVERLSEQNEKIGQNRQNLDSWLLGTFIPEIHDDLRAGQCFVVMTSRTRLPLDVIKDFNCDPLKLSFIKEADIKSFLKQKRVPQVLHDDIYKLTYGHGLCFSLFYELIQDKKPLNREDLADVTKRFYENASNEFLHKKVIKRQKDPFLNKIFNCVLEYEKFDFTIIRNILAVEFAEASRELDDWEYYSQLQSYPCVEHSEKDPHFHCVHSLIRSIHLRRLVSGASRRARDGSMSYHVPRSLFVGREAEKIAYQIFLQQEQQWLLLITGMAGTGKSRLLNHLLENSSPENTPIKLDFANKALQIEPLKILEDLSWKTRDSCDQNAVDQFNGALQQCRSQIENLSSRAVSQNGQSYSSTDKSHREEVDELRKPVLTALYNQLATYQKKHLVILLDNCEWINDDKDNRVGIWLKNYLIPGIHEHVQKKVPLHIVIASRTPVKSDHVSEQEQQLLKLSCLDKEAVQEYLRSLDINDKQLGLNIYNLTQGHPLCLSIMATLLHDEIQDKNIREALQPEISEKLEKKFTEQAFVELFQERLDSYLKSPYRELTRYGMLLRRFDLPLLQNVFQEVFQKIPSTEIPAIYEDFINFSYIETFEDQHQNKCYSLHILLREILVEKIRTLEPEYWEKYQDRAYKHYSEQKNPEQYYHRIALDECDGITAWQDAVEDAIAQNKNSSFIEELLKILDDDKTLKISERGKAIQNYVRGQYYTSILEWENALARYEEAHAVFKQANLKQADQLYKALVLKARGYVKSREQGQKSAALQDYKESLSCFRDLSIRDLSIRLQEAYVLQLMGDIKSLQKTQQTEALDDYKQAYSIFKELAEAEDQTYIASVQDTPRTRSNHKVLRVKSFPIDKSIHYTHITQDILKYNQFTVLKSMGNIYQEQGKWKQVKETCYSALQLHKDLKEILDRRAYFNEEAEIHGMEGRAKENDLIPNLKKARENYDKAIDFYRRAENGPGERVMTQAKNEARLLSRAIKRVYPVAVPLLLIMLIFTTLYIIHKPPEPSCTPVIGIGALPIKPGCGSETIGVSDGTVEFDEGLGNKELKQLAAQAEQKDQKNPAHNFSDAIRLWEKASEAAPNDAESLTYWEDLRVLTSNRPYVTFVVAAIFTPVGGDFVGGGRDILQGAYVAQKSNNDKCLQTTDECPLIRLLIANSGSNSARATDVAQQIVTIARSDQTVAGVTGWLNSATTINALKVLAQNHIPIVSSSASSDKLTNMSPYFFRVNPPDSSQGEAATKYAQNVLHAKNVALIEDPSDPYTASLANSFQKHFDTHKGKIVVIEHYKITSFSNTYAVLNDAISHHPDLIYFAGYAKDISSMLILLGSSLTNVNVMGGDALYVPGDYIPTVQTNAVFRHLYFTSFAFPGQSQNNTSKQNFLKMYQKDFDPDHKYAQNPSYGYNMPDAQSIFTFDALNALIKGYQNALPAKKGVYVTPDELRQGLSEIDKAHPLPGAGGQIAFLPNGDPAYKSIVILNGPSLNQVQVVWRSCPQEHCDP